MANKWTLTQDSFNRLLSWLDPDREQAGKKYEDIRYRLIKIFCCRGCRTPEDLADETINRVTRRLNDIADTYIGDPARYFCGVAHKVHLEYLKKRPAPLQPPEQFKKSEQEEQQYKCLEECMLHLTTSNREMVLEYYSEEKRAKIESRKQLAQKLGIPLNALRIRAYRIRAALQECVQNCMRRHAAE